jgi:Arc/MetJ-type ribon-helix-helix transcriptional regulator
MDDKKEKEHDDDEEEEDVEYISMCCHNGEHEGHEEFARKIQKKILLKLGDELEGRGNVVMTRLSDEDLKQIDALVEVEAFQSRSEATAFFIKEGIQARKDLFQKVMPTVDKIRELKEQAKKSLSKE